ncbi:DUF6412 domain-containing protein [Herbiconiux sp. 11R-BC]|uniref:DUF6412 domain-containing protein n=1 Tax=Herbiconiux sp. 11R-BC TaxID=3111637 RepID=UPI003BFCDFEF
MSDATRTRGSEGGLGRTALLRLLAVAMGLGFTWFVAAGLGSVAAPGLDPAPTGILAAVAVLAAAAGLAHVSASARLLLASILALSGPRTERGGDDDPGLPAVITQSRPDAPGRPQPRAPGRLLAVV